MSKKKLLNDVHIDPAKMDTLEKGARLGKPKEVKSKCNCKMCKSVEQSLKDVEKGRTIPYSEVKDMWKKDKQWRMKHPLLAKSRDSYYAIWRFFDEVKHIPYYVKCFFQRGIRGYSDRDWWTYPFHVSQITVGCLKRLKKDGHGLPTWGEEKTEKQAMKEWNDILDNIIYTFEMAVKIGDGDIDYIPTTQKDAEKARRICRRIRKNLNTEYSDVVKIKVLTAKESAKLEKGFDLFKKWFFHLWD